MSNVYLVPIVTYYKVKESEIEEAVKLLNSLAKEIVVDREKGIVYVDGKPLYIIVHEKDLPFTITYNIVKESDLKKEKR